MSAAAQHVAEMLARVAPGAAPRGAEPPAWALSRGSAVAYVVLLSDEFLAISAAVLTGVRRDDAELFRFLLELDAKLSGAYFTLEDDDSVHLRHTTLLVGLNDDALRGLLDNVLRNANAWDDRLRKRELALPPGPATAAPGGPSSAPAVTAALARLGLGDKATPVSSSAVPAWTLRVAGVLVQIAAGPELVVLAARTAIALDDPAALLARNRQLGGAFFALSVKGEVALHQMIPAVALTDDVLGYAIVNVGEHAARPLATP